MVPLSLEEQKIMCPEQLGCLVLSNAESTSASFQSLFGLVKGNFGIKQIIQSYLDQSHWSTHASTNCLASKEAFLQTCGENSWVLLNFIHEWKCSHSFALGASNLLTYCLEIARHINKYTPAFRKTQWDKTRDLTSEKHPEIYPGISSKDVLNAHELPSLTCKNIWDGLCRWVLAIYSTSKCWELGCAQHYNRHWDRVVSKTVEVQTNRMLCNTHTVLPRVPGILPST